MPERKVPIFDIQAETDTLLHHQVRAQKDYSSFQGSQTPLIIDNGSYECRVGWAGESDPRVCFENMVAKYRDRAANHPVIRVGPDALNDPSVRTHARSPFDGGILFSSDLLQYSLDYAFFKMGLAGERVDHPVLLTEALCNPSASRRMVTELMFEKYEVPSLSLAVSPLLAYASSKEKLGENAIIIDVGHSSTRVIPIIQGRPDIPHTAVIQYGGASAESYMLRLLQTKYPSFPLHVTPYQARAITRRHTYVASNFHEDLEGYARSIEHPETDKTLVFQFPYEVAEKAPEKTAEELERIEKRKKEHIEKLKEIAARTKRQKFEEKEMQLEAFMQLRDTKDLESREDWLARVRHHGFKDEKDLDATIKEIDQWIERTKAREAGIEPEEKKHDFSLLDVPDEELDEEKKKEKRKQRLLKAGVDARERARKEKEEEEARKAAELKAEQDAYHADPEGWIKSKREERKIIQGRIREKQKLREELSDRRSNASQKRMHAIATLAEDETKRKRRSTSGAGSMTGGSKRKDSMEDDGFGADDSDWHVYRDISKEEDEEEIEGDMSALQSVEELLSQYDPDFDPEDDGTEEDPHSLLRWFYHGDRDMRKGIYGADGEEDEEALAAYYQIRLNTERIRVPEGLFQPSIIGNEQTGLNYVLDDVYRTSWPSPEGSNDPVDLSIMLTGGFSQIPGLQERIEGALSEVLPISSRIRIIQTSTPNLDGWRGGSKWASQSTQDFLRESITAAEYAEKGADYLKESTYGNMPIYHSMGQGA